MLQQDLQADEYEHHAAQQFRPGLEPGAEHIADLHAHGGDDKGAHADQGDGGQDIDPQKGKGHAHSQRVDGMLMLKEAVKALEMKAKG